MSGTRHQTDVVIVGAGPVGLFAVFELGMLGLEAHVVDSLAAVGGQCQALYPEKPIYDIPGYPRILASELVERLSAQAAPFKPRHHLDQRVETLRPHGDGRWLVGTSSGAEIDCGAVIVAAGVGAFGPNRPPMDGLTDFEGQGAGVGVHYMVGRREDFRGKRLVIAGGGDSALDWTLSLAELAEKIYVVHRRDKFRAAPESVQRMRELAAAPDARVEIVVPYQLHAVAGANGRLEGVDVATLDDEVRRLEADALLPFFGLSMNLGPIAEWGLDLERGTVVVDPAACESSTSGIFAVGDIATYPGKLKLILSGFSESALAAHAIYKRLHPDTPLHWEYSTTKGVPGAAG